jgi:Fe-S cluster assembly protein SufD
MTEMIDLKGQANSLIGNFTLLRDLLKSYGSEVFHGLRERSLAKYELAGIPTSKDEEFKYLSLRILEEGNFGPAYGATVDRHQVEATGIGALEAITVAFINGEYAPELSSAHVLPDGVFVGALADGFQFQEDLILSKLGTASTLQGRLGSTNDERFVDLNTAYLGEGAFVAIPKGITLAAPIHLLWIASADHGPFVSHPRSLIVLAENSQAKIVESYIGLEGIYFTNAVTEAFLGENAILELDRFQQETEDAVHISTTAISQESSSTMTSNCVNFGGKISRNDVNVWIGGEHTETWLNGVSVGIGHQVIDNHTRIDHAKPHCHSFETYKTILNDHAHGVFNGKIFVYEDAQKTDAKQTNQTLLLSPTATISTKPQLEIFADDVKCTHGATIGQLRDEAMFYFQSRGIPKDHAKALLVYAFAAEVLEKITVPEARKIAEKQLYEKLGLKLNEFEGE